MPERKRLPDERKGRTKKLVVGGTDVYIRTGEYEDGTVGEIFITLGKQGDEQRLLDLSAIAVSVGLQYGIPLGVFTKKFKNWRCGTSGPTSDIDIPLAQSIIDYVAKWLEAVYLTTTLRETIPEHEDLVAVCNDLRGQGAEVKTLGGREIEIKVLEGVFVAVNRIFTTKE